MKTGAKQTVLISEIISVFILAVVFIFATPIVTVFGLGQEAVGYCSAHVRFVALVLPLFASYFPLLGLFQGANNALFSTFVATGASVLSMICMPRAGMNSDPMQCLGRRRIWTGPD